MLLRKESPGKFTEAGLRVEKVFLDCSLTVTLGASASAMDNRDGRSMFDRGSDSFGVEFTNIPGHL